MTEGWHGEPSRTWGKRERGNMGVKGRSRLQCVRY